MPHVSLTVAGEVWPSATELTYLLPQDWLWSWYKSEVKKNGYEGWENCNQISEKGKSLGSETHSVLESLVLKSNKPEVSSEAAALAQALYEKVDPLVEDWVVVEPHLRHERLKMQGTADMIVRMAGSTGLWIGDWKTSFHKTNTHPIQLAIYAMCWNEQHPDQLIDQGFIARVDKKSEKLTVKIDEYKGLTDFYPVIMALRTLWDYQNNQGFWRKI